MSSPLFQFFAFLFSIFPIGGYPRNTEPLRPADHLQHRRNDRLWFPRESHGHQFQQGRRPPTAISNEFTPALRAL